MASAWVETYRTPSGQSRCRAKFTLGGRGSRARHGGSFRRKSDANLRAAWLRGELASMRVPDLMLLDERPEHALTLRLAVEKSRTSRIDVSEGTRTNDRVNTERVLKHDAKLGRAGWTSSTLSAGRRCSPSSPASTGR